MTKMDMSNKEIEKARLIFSKRTAIVNEIARIPKSKSGVKKISFLFLLASFSNGTAITAGASAINNARHIK